MESEDIEGLFLSNEKVSREELSIYFNKKLEELFEKEKGSNLMDFDEIQYSAKIDLIYELMPSLKDKIRV